MAAGSKRGQGEGGLFYLKARDRWAFEIDLGIVDGKRKRVRHTFKKRQEAARALAAALRAVEEGLRPRMAETCCPRTSTTGSAM